VFIVVSFPCLVTAEDEDFSPLFLFLNTYGDVEKKSEVKAFFFFSPFPILAEKERNLSFCSRSK